MIEKWKLALKEFLKKYEEDDDVIGALLCGSYATDNQTDSSDIGVYLVLKDGTRYYEKGNMESNSYLIGYFMNTADGIKRIMEEEISNGRHGTTSMFGYGKIIYDVEGKVKELQDLALDYIDRPLNNITSEKLCNNNYYLWDCLDELKVSLDEKRNDFRMLYYSLLSKAYNIYAEYLSIPKLPDSKVYRVLIDEEYRRNYHAFKLPEKEFIKLYLKCFDDTKEDIMYKNISNLINNYYEKQGGFNIRNFKLRTEI